MLAGLSIVHLINAFETACEFELGFFTIQRALTVAPSGRKISRGIESLLPISLKKNYRNHPIQNALE